MKKKLFCKSALIKKISLIFLIANIFIFSAHAQSTPDALRPLFKKQMIQVGTKKIEVEIADTEEKRAYGFMYLKKLSKDQGMLFIFESEQPLAFWMKNTFVDLSIGYFDKNKILIDIKNMRGQKSVLNQDLRSYPSKTLAQYALEVPMGWYETNKIKVGNKLSFVNK